MFRTCLIGLSLALSACGTSAPIIEGELPPLRDYLSCLPEASAMMSAHRGTSRDWDAPENSISAMQKLMDQNYLMAEIDIAQLKDGTLIAFHDGVWEDMTTGQGAVAASHVEDLDNILLETRQGKLTADRPAKLSDLFELSKGKIYFEIDFKSSAKYQDVIAMIREYDLSDQVILISYSQGQSNKLKSLAPEMLLSVSPKDDYTDEAIWLGYEVGSADPTRFDKDAFLIGRVKTAGELRRAAKVKSIADILVTDHINQYMPITGLTKTGRAELKACLSAS